MSTPTTSLSCNSEKIKSDPNIVHYPQSVAGHVIGANTRDDLTRRIPVELCSEIFKYCTSNFYNPGRLSAFQISCISKTWKAIAFTTPQLWSSLTINLNKWRTGRVAFEEGKETLKKLLLRSGVCPLYLTISANNHVGLSHVDTVLDLLCEHSDRWEMLKIKALEEVIRHLLVQCVDTPLRDLDATTVNGPPSLVPFFTADHFAAPSVVRMDGLNFSTTPIRWPNLTAFYGTGYDSLVGLALLRFAPLLEHLRLGGMPHHKVVDLSAESIVNHPRIKTLELEGNTLALSLFFEKIVTPSIKKLAFHAYNDFMAYGDFLDFLRRCNGSLASLVLQGDNITYGTRIMELFEAIPSLKHLKLTYLDSNFIRHFMTRFAATQKTEINPAITSTDNLLPNLESLQIQSRQDSMHTWFSAHTEPTTLSHFPPETPPPGFLYRPLSSLILNVHDRQLVPLRTETLRKIDELRARGLTFKVYGGGMPEFGSGEYELDLIVYSKSMQNRPKNSFFSPCFGSGF